MDFPNNNNEESAAMPAKDGLPHMKSKADCLLPCQSSRGTNKVQFSKGPPPPKEDTPGEQQQLISSVTDVARRKSDGDFPSFLGRVDPIVDFWTVDEELVGRFRVSSVLPSANHPKLWSQQAIIFKVKTTSPHNFVVRPVFGLMKPNVIAGVDVRCEVWASKAKMETDEFLLEIAPVPGAIAGMTSDLYTSAVASNVPALLAIWERIEEETKKGSYEGAREYHRVSCRFHAVRQDQGRFRFTASSSNSNRELLGTSQGGLGDNNFLLDETDSTSTSLCENCSFSQPSQMECYLAREFSSESNGERDCGDKLCGPGGTGGKGRRRRNCSACFLCSCCCCGPTKGLRIFNLILALLLIGSLGYIFYEHFYFDNDETNHKYANSSVEAKSGNKN